MTAASIVSVVADPLINPGASPTSSYGTRGVMSIIGRGYVVYSEPGKLVFTGIVMGVLAIGAFLYVSESEDDGSPVDQLDLASHDELPYSARGDLTSGAVAYGAVKSRSDSAASVADRLNSARRSLLRDDVAAARAQPNTIRAAREDDRAVVEVKKRAQADQERRALAASQAEKAARTVEKAGRTPSPSQVKSAHSRDSRMATRAHSNHVPSYTRNPRAAEIVTAVAGGYSPWSGRGSAASVPPHASESADVPQAMQAVENTPATHDAPTVPVAPLAEAPWRQPQSDVQPALSAPQTEPVAQAIVPPPMVQTMRSGGDLSKLDGGPKSRAQVRGEIVHAREDGSLPRSAIPTPPARAARRM
ncbi:hypothetical protein [Paraburkholderia sp. SG-MS1]|uniref:hypothetical protein n=1 Tax=Paraburkholderia sp. SG-MS1 TaxID=2023741 RepID=UPI001445638D|nr:hypothetical protein [Paraburkholderia sp. SG-MS1]